MKTIEDLKQEKDKMEIFRDFEQLKQYIVTVKDLLDAVSECLTDEEKLEVIKLDYFQRQAIYVKSRAVMDIKDAVIKGQIIRDISFLESIFDQYNFSDFLKTLDEESKLYVLNSPEILKKFNVQSYKTREIIATMSDKNKQDILLDKKMMEKLGLSDYDAKSLIKGIQDDKIKLEIAGTYQFTILEMVEIVKSVSDETKKRVILEDKQGFQNRHILDVLSSLEVETIIDFIQNKQEFLTSKEIKIFKIIKMMSVEKQLQIIEQLDKIDLTEAEKRRIYACLKNETKKQIDLEKIDANYRNLIGMELSEEIHSYGKIIPMLEGDVSQYKDLDGLISINPLQMVKTDEDREKLLKLCQICPNVKIEDDILIGNSIGEEYIKGEEWVNSVLGGIQPEWTDVQKLAYIDTMIGKRISYSPEFGTEAERTGDARALWRIIANGYGVCNGIAQIEQYILLRAGIESELVSSGIHTFVKVKNIQISTENGVVQGDTLVDPTWNLATSRFGALPQHFCKSYEELRKVDFDSKGQDHECHKNDDLEQDQTIDMDINSLREVYKSIGIADREGYFPIGQLTEQAKQIDETSPNMQSNIRSKFELLKKWCPEFATCQNSTMTILKDVLFEPNEHFDFKRCIASRVYDKQDPEKAAVLYVYMELEGLGKQFFYADKESGEFIQLSQQEFEAKFECYEADKEKLPGNRRPWESEIEIEEKKEYSSGQVETEEGR